MSRKQFHIGGASSDVRCLAREGGGGGGGGARKANLILLQLAEFMHAGVGARPSSQNIGGARPPPLSEY